MNVTFNLFICYAFVISIYTSYNVAFIFLEEIIQKTQLVIHMAAINWYEKDANNYIYAFQQEH